MYPVDFEELRSRILKYSWSSKLEVREIPAPTRISPFSVAIEGSVIIKGDELGSGRLILLHNPSGSDAWRGTSRFVAMIRAEVDPSMASDPLVGNVAWSWLTDSLDTHHALRHAEAGTVTSVVSRPRVESHRGARFMDADLLDCRRRRFTRGIVERPLPALVWGLPDS